MSWTVLHLIIFCVSTYNLTGEVIRVATYNVRNYLEVDRWVDGHYRPKFPKPEEEKQALRSIIISVHPDILVIQEMGPGPYLNELQADLKEAGIDFPYKYIAEASDEERHVALLSRIKPMELVTHDDLKFTYFQNEIPVKRGMMEVDFLTNGINWKLFGLHLKSKWSDYKEDPNSNERRRSEALACRSRILELQKKDGLPFLILGDLNDTKSTPPIRLLQFRGKNEVAGMVDTFDSRGDRWTHYFEAEDTYTRIDYILKSPDFPAAVMENHAHVYDGPGYLEASDHRLVWIDLEWEGVSL
jgi:endonuclease/exonuclease/phosphatase family metal-dependent hydrolase